MNKSNSIQISDDHLESLLLLINREIASNEKNGDDAYNTYWENLKVALGFEPVQKEEGGSMNEVKQYRKKPVVIEAVQLTRENGEEAAKWCGGAWTSLYGRGDHGEDLSHVRISTLKGDMRADLGDYIIRGVKGEFYPVMPGMFEATYEPVEA